MIASLIRLLTGRSYQVRSRDIGYLLAKGGWPLLRGLTWSLRHFRRPNGLLLGPYISFVMGRQLQAGRGAAIGGYSYVDCSADQGIVLGARVTIRERAWIQGRSGLNQPAAGLWIEDGSYIGPNAVLGIGGPIRIGANVQIGAGFTISAESHVADDDGSYVTGRVDRQGVLVGDRCWIGNNVVVLDGVEIGEGCVIGAASVVTRSLPPFSLAFGAPATVRRTLRPSRPADYTDGG
jgi:acetyltransferase-like isoleucine patch superfamily enzyme